MRVHWITQIEHLLTSNFLTQGKDEIPNVFSEDSLRNDYEIQGFNICHHSIAEEKEDRNQDIEH